VRCGRSAADPPDDPVVVEAAGEVTARGVLVYSDGGGIYGDEDYLKKLEEHGVKRSMSRKRNP